MEFLIIVCVWAGRTRATLLGGAFRKAKYEKLRRRKKKRRKRGRAKIPPPNPLPFCPLERKNFCSCRVKRGNQNSQSGFSSKKFGFRPINTTKVYLQCDFPRSGKAEFPSKPLPPRHRLGWRIFSRRASLSFPCLALPARKRSINPLKLKSKFSIYKNPPV